MFKSHFVKLGLAVAALFAIPQNSSALISVAEVTVEKAKEMGIDVVSRPAGPGRAWVEVSFRRAGSLKKFDPDRYGKIHLHPVGCSNPTTVF